jgi:hypothetical protein
MTYVMTDHLAHRGELSDPAQAGESFDEAARAILPHGGSGQILWIGPQSADNHLRVDNDIEAGRAALTWLPDDTVGVDLEPGPPGDEGADQRRGRVFGTHRVDEHSDNPQRRRQGYRRAVRRPVWRDPCRRVDLPLTAVPLTHPDAAARHLRRRCLIVGGRPWSVVNRAAAS